MDRYSVRFHGLGGQGLKSMMQEMVAPLLMRMGFSVQAFPFFGGERRGAAVIGYLRFGTKPITTHSFIEEPDMVVLFDERIAMEHAVHNLRPGSILLVNSPDARHLVEHYQQFTIFSLNARAISIKNSIGQNDDPFLVINTAMAGAFLRVLEIVANVYANDHDITAVLEGSLSKKIAENTTAIHEGKDAVINASGLRPDSSADPRFGITGPNDRCTKCKLCYLFCPKRAIAVSADDAYTIAGDRCNYCGICVAVCPRDAITLFTNTTGETS